MPHVPTVKSMKLFGSSANISRKETGFSGQGEIRREQEMTYDQVAQSSHQKSSGNGLDSALVLQC